MNSKTLRSEFIIQLMPVKIRLMRIGAKKRPFYRVVAVDERKKRTGQYLELLGTYNPLTKPKEINLKQERIDDWIKRGAQPSVGFLRITGKAPQRPPRKPKKAIKEAKPAAAEATAAAANEQPTQASIENGQPQEEDASGTDNAESENTQATPATEGARGEAEKQ